MKPEDITNITELDTDFAKDLKGVKDPDSFLSFLKKWEYWLDPETVKLKGLDWLWMKPVVPEGELISAWIIAHSHKIFHSVCKAVDYINGILEDEGKS